MNHPNTIANEVPRFTLLTQVKPIAVSASVQILNTSTLDARAYIAVPGVVSTERLLPIGFCMTKLSGETTPAYRKTTVSTPRISSGNDAYITIASAVLYLSAAPAPKL